MSNSIEHLVASVEKNASELYREMNLKCDAVIANQSSKAKQEIIDKKIGNNTITIINTKQKGVGKNRNQALLFAKSEICILSDDDMKYKDNYISIINGAFDRLPQADVIIFNLDEQDSNRHRRNNKKIKRIHKYNFMNYGAARVVFRRESILRKNIWFSTKFGGGAKYGSGEDTLFISECLKKRLKIYAYPRTIATVDCTISSWYKGKNDSFYHDKGALFYAISPHFYIFLIIIFAFKFKSDKIDYHKRIKIMKSGANEYRNRNI